MSDDKKDQKDQSTRDELGRFKLGGPCPNPNPGNNGAKRGLVAFLRRETGDGEEMGQILLSIARGEPQRIRHELRLGDGQYVELEGIPDALIPSVKDRQDAVHAILNRLLGRAPVKVELEDGQAQTLFDPRKLTPKALRLYAQLLDAVDEPATDTADAGGEAVAPADGAGGDLSPEVQ